MAFAVRAGLSSNSCQSARESENLVAAQSVRLEASTVLLWHWGQRVPGEYLFAVHV